jgi:hypothetical protein
MKGRILEFFMCKKGKQIQSTEYFATLASHRVTHIVNETNGDVLLGPSLFFFRPSFASIASSKEDEAHCNNIAH